MDMTEAMARGAVLIVMVYAFWLAVRLLRSAWRWLTGSAVNDAARLAGKASRVVENKVSDAAAAFKDGRR